MSVSHCALPSSGEPFSGASHGQVAYLPLRFKLIWDHLFSLLECLSLDELDSTQYKHESIEMSKVCSSVCSCHRKYNVAIAELLRSNSWRKMLYT
jgi:hypothetical protein